MPPHLYFKKIDIFSELCEKSVFKLCHIILTQYFAYYIKTYSHMGWSVCFILINVSMPAQAYTVQKASYYITT